MTAGDDFTAAVTQDQRVFVWGSNGYPNPFEKTFFEGRNPRQVKFILCSMESSTNLRYKAQIFLEQKISSTAFQISAGNNHMAVLLNNGSVVTWGSRRLGQAGREFPGQFTLEPGFLDAANIHAVRIQSTCSLSFSFFFFVCVWMFVWVN